MSTAMLNIRMTPRRMLPLREAAEYVGYAGAAAKKFTGLCPVTPVEMPDGSRHARPRSLAGQPEIGRRLER